MSLAGDSAEAVRARVRAAVAEGRFSSPSALASEADVAPSTLLQFLKGSTAQLRKGTLMRIADVLGVPMHVLLSKPGAEPDEVEVSLTLDSRAYDLFAVVSVIERSPVELLLKRSIEDAARALGEEGGLDEIVDAVAGIRSRRRPNHGTT